MDRRILLKRLMVAVPAAAAAAAGVAAKSGTFAKYTSEQTLSTLSNLVDKTKERFERSEESPKRTIPALTALAASRSGSAPVRYFRMVCATAMLLGASATALAHHSYIRIDRNAIIAFEATVLDFQWRNPHIYILIGVTDENGNQAEWEIESGSTPILAHSGWAADSLEVGDTISVRAHPERGTNRNYALLESLTTPEGQVLRQGILPSNSTETTSSITGTWKSRLEDHAPIEVLSALFAEFMEVPLTEAGRESIAVYDHDRENPNAVCYGYDLVAGLTSPHYMNQIEINDDHVIIRDEWFDAERIIYTDDRGLPVDAKRQRLGHSIGRWEGDTLVVETEMFAEHRSPYGIGLASGEQKRVEERYTLNDDGRSITLDVHLEDPEYLTRSFSGTLNWDYVPDFDFYRYDCDPSVATRFSYPE